MNIVEKLWKPLYINAKRMPCILWGKTYPHDRGTRKLYTVSKIREDIYRSDAPVTFELYIYFKCLQFLYSNKTTFTNFCLPQWISWPFRRSFDIHWVRQYLVTFTGLTAIVNTTFYKTEHIFAGPGRGKLSLCLTLWYMITFLIVSTISSCWHDLQLIG